MPVTRRKLITELHHDADGTVGSVQITIQLEADNPLNPNRPIIERDLIQLGTPDMTTGDKTALTAISSLIEAMMERKVPLVERNP